MAPRAKNPQQEPDQENWEERAIQALTGTPAFPDILRQEPIRAVRDSLGVTMEEAEAYVQGLESCRRVRLCSTLDKVVPVPGMEPFLTVYWWEECSPDLDSKPGINTPK